VVLLAPLGAAAEPLVRRAGGAAAAACSPLRPVRPCAAQGDNISTTSPYLGAPSHRVHCSLNLNTDTGRLSARRPNLQNQPALEKDR
jgi:hypothetical protein